MIEGQRYRNSLTIEEPTSSQNYLFLVTKFDVVHKTFKFQNIPFNPQSIWSVIQKETIYELIIFVMP